MAKTPTGKAPARPAAARPTPAQPARPARPAPVAPTRVSTAQPQAAPAPPRRGPIKTGGPLSKAGRDAKARQQARREREHADAPTVPPGERRIRVRAIAPGFYKLKRRREGDVFTIPAKLFSERWMERVSDATPERVTTGQGEINKMIEEKRAGLGRKHNEGLEVDPDVEDGRARTGDDE